jgi:hypothetical protein
LRLFAVPVAAACAVALGPTAHADDDLFTPDQPPIVVGGTVNTPATIVVDPGTPAGTPDPINPNQPIGVDPRTVPPKPRKPTINGLLQVQWYPDATPPVTKVDEKKAAPGKWVYLDNHGRFWLYDVTVTPRKLEQVGGWPQEAGPNAPPDIPTYYGPGIG